VSPSTRVALGSTAAAAAMLLLATVFSEHWFHAADRFGNGIDWSGFGGPYNDTRGTTAGEVMNIIAGLSAMFAPLCALLVAFGTIAGRRRDHVPRLPALLATIAATTAVALQAIAITTWPISRQLEPRGYGWAMPLFFVAGLALAGAAATLWRDASRRARTSAEALAKVNRELAAKDLAALPELAPEEPPVERV